MKKHMLKKDFCKKGLSLVEILLAITILAFSALAIIQTYLQNLNFAALIKDNTVALTHLTNVIEDIKCTAFNNLLVRFPNGTIDGPAGNKYTTLVGGYSLKNEHITVTYVNTGADPLEITASLNWLDKLGVNRVASLITKRTR